MQASEPVFVVWGPTAEWGDGSGPLGYFSNRTDAEVFIQEEKEAVAEAEMTDAWPYNLIDYGIEETTLAQLEVPASLLIQGEDAVFEVLNER